MPDCLAECERRCCEDETCEVWQFGSALQGCTRGRPTTCATGIYTILAGSIYTSIEGSDFSLTLGAPESLGESALAAETEHRVRSSSVFAGPSGACVLVWPVSCLETVVGFELQAESLALQNRKLIERASCGGGVPSIARNLSRAQVDTLLSALGPSVTFTIFAGICATGICFVALFVPETKGKTFEEIEALFR